MRHIEVDFDVHLRIENERRGFEETPNDVLRRLLELSDKPAPAPAPITANAYRTGSRKAEVRRIFELEGAPAAMAWGLRAGLTKGTLQTWMSRWSVAKKRGWSGDGVELPNETRVRMKYSGKNYEGVIKDGLWMIGDEAFTSPSGAASGVATTKAGTRTRLDGWMYWEVFRPGDAGWTPLRALRLNG